MDKEPSLSRFRSLLQLSVLSSLRRRRARAAGLVTIPFQPPRDGTLLENYIVNYELESEAGARYRSSYTVYIYEQRGQELYLVKEPYVSPELGASVADAVSSLSTWLAPSPIISVDPLGYLFAELRRGGYLGAKASDDDLKAATHYLIRDILGYSTIDPLIRDPEIEDISCQGLGRGVKVWHRRFNSRGWLDTNVVFDEMEALDSVVTRLVHRSHRSLSVSAPIVDCVLPEGYRLAATWGKEVTSLGSSFSIRKLRSNPYTVVDLIKTGTLDPRTAAYLWLLLEMKGFVMVAGVTASGKTTLLNGLGAVLNPNWKVLSIEDTREIRLPQSGWKPLHTRYTGSERSTVTLFDLVKLSLRERPDFVILGESRGEEVQVLFQAAASGSGCLTTFHASNQEGLVARLTQPPLSVARSSLGLIDAVVFMVTGEGNVRRVKQVAEPGVEWRTLFEASGTSWQGEASSSERLERRAAGLGYSAKRVASELERRELFLQKMVGKGVCRYEELSGELRSFYAASRP